MDVEVTKDILHPGGLRHLGSNDKAAGWMTLLLALGLARNNSFPAVYSVWDKVRKLSLLARFQLDLSSLWKKVNAKSESEDEKDGLPDANFFRSVSDDIECGFQAGFIPAPSNFMLQTLVGAKWRSHLSNWLPNPWSTESNGAFINARTMLDKLTQARFWEFSSIRLRNGTPGGLRRQPMTYIVYCAVSILELKMALQRATSELVEGKFLICLSSQQRRWTCGPFSTASGPSIAPRTVPYGMHDAPTARQTGSVQSGC